MLPAPWCPAAKNGWRCETPGLHWSHNWGPPLPRGLVSWNCGCSGPHSESSRVFTAPRPTAFLTELPPRVTAHPGGTHVPNHGPTWDFPVCFLLPGFIPRFTDLGCRTFP